MIAAVIFYRAAAKGFPEEFVSAGRRAFTRDLVSSLLQAGLANIFLLTGEKEFGTSMSEEGVQWISPQNERAFHFGRELQAVVREQGISGVLYFGSGSGGLLTSGQVSKLISFAKTNRSAALFNNFYSCDFAAISGAGELENVELPPIDNQLGFSLAAAGFPCFSVPRVAASQFDIDTPTDLLILAAAERGGLATNAFCRERELYRSHILELVDRLADRKAHIYLIGRVNPANWAWFEREVACRTSGLIEGRGLRAYPNKSGTVIAKTMARAEIGTFLRWLTEIADGALIDTRPILARDGDLPPASDRFASDLLLPGMVTDPLWAEFTRMARAAEIPIIIGGHSLVSGGLYLLAELCWRRKRLPRRLHPEPIDW
jgi:hypothetical protein